MIGKESLRRATPPTTDGLSGFLPSYMKRGSLMRADVLVNYCPELRTILANEEVDEGRSKEGGFPVERRPLKQWVLKITEYAERLLDDLDALDWPEHLKTLQRRWIGKSCGATITFLEHEKGQSIDVYTTRCDTLFAATFVVISPEHPLLRDLISEEQRGAVECYLKETARKSDLERTELAKTKSGVRTGAFARHPASNALIPIWVADYVLMGYGTGAIMGVPGGDERDFDFAKKYGIAVIPPYDPHIEEIQPGMDRNTLRLDILAGKCPWNGPGVAINGRSDSLDINGLELGAAQTAVLKWLKEKGIGEECTTYKLRDWLFSRQRYWGEPIPILHFEDGTKRALGPEELPLLLPDIAEYRPQKEATTPLDNALSWVHTTDAKTGKRGRRETNTMPQWAGSCWYYLRFCDPHNKEEGWSKKAENYWMPVDMYVGGVEHAVLHLLYARFWHKVLYDCGYVSTKEPFQKLRNQGLIVAKSYARSGGGYVSPEDAIHSDEIIERIEKNVEV